MTKQKMEFKIGGMSIAYEIRHVNIDLIDLDPENPRLGYWQDVQDKDIYTQNDVEAALLFEDDQGVQTLKRNIEVNEDIINPIWVLRKKERYIAIDGNTRLKIFGDLRKKYPHKECYSKIKCKILPENTEQKAIEFIRLEAHLRGVNDWEVYVRAKNLYSLYYNRGYDYEELQNKTKLSQNQIIRAIEAYKNMSEQFLPEYGNQPDASRKFSYFVEFETPKIKGNMEICNLTIKDFCKWVGEGQIKKAQDVRDLKKIFASENAKKALIEKGYEAAVDQLSLVQPGFRSKLFDSVEDVIEGLRNMTRLEEEDIIDDENPARRNLLKDLHKEMTSIVKKLN